MGSYDYNLYAIGISEGYGTLSGKVADLSTGSPIASVTVSALGGSTQTGTDGSYALYLEPGVYDVTFAKTGYQTITITDVPVTEAKATTLNVELTTPGPLNITTTSLPPAETTEPYNQRIWISGGSYPYTYTIAYGSLPAGLTLDPAYGNIAGTPTTKGSQTFAVGVEDALGTYAEREFTIEVTEKLAIVTNSPLSRGTRGVSYFLNIVATDGTLPYTFTKTSGSLPSGLTLATDGKLSGTPTATGAYDFTVRVIDASGRTDEKAFHLEIVDPLVITTSKLNDGVVGTAYNQTLTASGGYGAYQWAVYSGILPAGLTLNSQSGVLSGTPTEDTFGTIIFSVRDAEGRITYKDLSLRVVNPLVILTTAMPNGLVGAAYSEAIRTSGGVGPYTFSLTGQLPAGLTLNTSTGVISGTPTVAGFTNLTITATDSTYPTKQSVTQNLSIRITSTLTIITSAVLPDGKKGVAINPVVLRAAGGPSPYTWAIAGGYMPEGISLDSQTGTLSGTPQDKGDFVFTLQVTDANKATAQKEFFWHISDTLAIETGAIPDGAIGVYYSFTLEAAGGKLPYAWRIKSGTLPSGLTLNQSTGTIYGTPTIRQTYSFTLEVSDAASPAQTTEKTYTMEVLDQLYIYTKSLPNGRLSQAYKTTLEARLGKPPYTWKLASGVLPSGLSLKGTTSTATLEGTPTKIGTYVFTIEVSDTGTPVSCVTKEYTMEIYGIVDIVTTGLKTAVKGVPYSDTVVVSGGELPYTWSLVSGSLPAGLTLNSTSGHVSGITNLVTGQSSTFTVRVTDSGSPTGVDEKEFVIYVVDPLEIVTTAIQNSLEGSAYKATLAGKGGISPYQWGISSGALPQGLTLAAATGVIAGTPTTCGDFSFTAQFKDSAPAPNVDTQAFTLEVLCKPPTAAFSVNPTSGGAPLAVTFTDQSTGTVTAWNWNFGDTKTSNEKNPIHTYVNPGTYTVSHTVTGPGGSDAETKTNLITALDVTPPNPPVVSGTTPTNDTTPTWTWTSGGGGGNGKYRYKLDSGTWGSETTATSYTPTTALAASTHALYVQERDAAGNWSASGSKAIVIDTTDPNAPVVSGRSKTRDKTPTWTWTSGGNDGNGTYRYKLDNSDLSIGATETTQTSYTPTSKLAKGTRTLYVQERDAAGNWSASGSKATTVK